MSPARHWNAASKGALTIAGGFSSCADTTPDDAAPATLQFDTGSVPAITVDATGAAGSFVTLRRIHVFNLDPGGGIVVRANGTVNLQRTAVRGWAPTFGTPSGRGIEVAGDSTLTVDRYSVIHDNGHSSSNGGGVHCVDPGSFVYLDGEVRRNSGVIGGGIYVGNRCELALGPHAGVYGNDAVLGGGIAALGARLRRDQQPHGSPGVNGGLHDAGAYELH